MNSRLRALPVAALAFAIVGCSGQPSAGARNTGSTDESVTTAGSRQDEAQSAAEYADRLIGCLRAQGFDVTITQGGGFDVKLGGSSDQAFQDTEAQCRKDIGFEPTPAPLTVAEIQQLYAWALEERDCLVAHGFSPTEPTSEQVYIEQYQAMLAPWSPYAEIQDSRAEVLCPQHILGEP